MGLKKMESKTAFGKAVRGPVLLAALLFLFWGLSGCGEAREQVEADGRWRLTAEGFLLSNQIILSALEALGREKERRQRAAQNHDFRVTG